MGLNVKLELAGLDGNCFILLGEFQKAARRQGFTKEEIQKVIDEAKSSDYDHLLGVLIDNCVSPDERQWDGDCPDDGDCDTCPFVKDCARSGMDEAEEDDDND